MSARVCSPPMTDLLGSSSLPSSANIPAGHHHGYYPTSTMSTTSMCSEILPKSRNVSRNLFGSPDPKSAEYARNKVKEIRKTDTKKWNFDFDREVPLTGRFQWVPVAVEPPVPVVPPVSSSARETSSPVLSVTTIKTVIKSSSTSISSSSKQPSKKLITDHFRKRKAPSKTATTAEKKAK